MTIDIRTNVSHYIYSQQFSQLIPRCLTSLTFYMLYNPYFICICYVLRPAFDNRVSDIGQIICRCGCTLNLCKILNTQISFLGMERITEDMREKLEKMRKMKINAAVLSTSYFEGNKTNILLVL